MSFEAWPSPDARRGPLPRIEDLPIAEQGYDQEAVRRAFDDFYRHAARLDASLKVLEAVEAFQRDAALLRADLRSLQAGGLAGGTLDAGWAPATWTVERSGPELSPTAFRLAAEAALLIAVAVVAGVAHLRAWAIVALMAGALLAVWISEWLAARARVRVAASVHEPIGYPEAPQEPAGEPAPFVEAPALEPAVGWSAFEAPANEDELPAIEPLEDTEEDVEAGSAGAGAGAGEPAADAGEEEEQEPEDDVEGQTAEEPAAEEPGRRRGWFRRRRGEAEQTGPEPEQQTEPERPPSHVRLLAREGAQDERSSV